MYTISNKDREELIEFLADYREIYKQLPDEKKDLREDNRVRRAYLLLKKLERKKEDKAI